MDAGAWLAVYRSDLQSVWALGVVPLLYLLHRAAAGAPAGGGAEPASADFVRAWSLLFAVETLVDPWATGPLAKALGPAAGTGLGLAFVLLGDFRVLWLALRVARPERPGRAAWQAAALTPAVPLLAFAATRGLAAWGGALPDQALWLAHELLFLGLAVLLGRSLLPRLAGPGRPAAVAFLRSWMGFVAGYYGLWAACDVLILAGVPEGWALRAIPNQLYYGLTVPFASWRFFAARYASTSSAVHASR